MKKIFFIVIIAIAAFTAVKAQETAQTLQYTEAQDFGREKPMYRNIYVELFGASNLIGISYDSRIKPGSPFGFRAGVAYAYGESRGFFDHMSDKASYFSVPAAFNCILGKRKSKFEVGFGINMGIFSIEDYTNLDADGYPTIFNPTYVIRETRNIFGYYFFSDIGYRYQRENGFMLRVGVSPSFSFAGDHGVSKTPFLYPYLSLGYTFGK